MENIDYKKIWHKLKEIRKEEFIYFYYEKKGVGESSDMARDIKRGYYAARENLKEMDKLDGTNEFEKLQEELKNKKAKKYYIRFKNLSDKQNYLGFTTYSKKSGEWVFNSESEFYDFKTRFTLEELPLWVHEMLEQGHLFKEEIKLND